MREDVNNERLGVRSGLISIILNLLLFGLKYYAGIVSASVALIADAWHTLSDSLTSIVLIVGIKLSAQKPDKEHPFGHGRWEQISALAIALVLVFVGIEFVQDGIDKLQHRETASFGWLAYAVTIVSIIVKESMARYSFYVAKKIDSSSVKADGWHHRSDALSSVVVLAGLLLSNYCWWIDGVLGIIVSIMLFYVSYGIIREAVNIILGEEPSEEMITQIKEVVREQVGEDAQPHHFHIHHYGNHSEFTMHVKVDGNMTVREAHERATRVESCLKRDMNLDATIHIEPIPR